MRIALVAEDYYPQLGGVPEHVHNLALQLNAWGHTATVVTSHMGDYPDAPFVRRVGKSRVIYSNGGVSRVTTGWRLRRRLEELFRAGRYDIVHVHGGLAPTFGLAALFEAMPRILARYPRAVLTVAGEGPWRHYYERRARAEGLGASVRFAGQVFEDRPAYYGSADLYLCPTTIASFGVTLLEAMACGTPMVVSDNHGFRSVIAGGAEALVIPKDDPAVWAETTIALLGDPARREAMARAGVDKAQRFAWPRIARQELGVYERVLGRSAKPARRPTRRASERASTTG